MAVQSVSRTSFRRVQRLTGTVVCGAVLLAALAGCDSGTRSSDDSSAPPVPVAPATPPEGASVPELRNQLHANENARFVRKGGELAEVGLNGSPVADLSSLKGLPIRVLEISATQVTDLSPLAGMPLELLEAEGTPISDLAPLKGLPLQEVYLRDTKVADLAPLAESPVRMLNVVGTQVTDLAPVKQMPLGTLWVASTGVKDLSPLAGKHLESLDVENTPVDDLAVLAGMESLRRLNLAGSAVTDLSPLAGLRLDRLVFTPGKITKGIEAVRGMSSLTELGTTLDDRMPAEVFWSRYDKGEFRDNAAPNPAP